MIGSASFPSPLCTWLVAAACMSVTCSKENSTTSVNRLRRRRRALLSSTSCCSSAAAAGGCSDSEFVSRGLVSSFCGSSFQGLMSCCLAFEPCSQYYSSNGLFRSANLNRKHRRLSRPSRSGNLIFLSLFCFILRVFLAGFDFNCYSDCST